MDHRRQLAGRFLEDLDQDLSENRFEPIQRSHLQLRLLHLLVLLQRLHHLVLVHVHHRLHQADFINLSHQQLDYHQLLADLLDRRHLLDWDLTCASWI